VSGPGRCPNHAHCPRRLSHLYTRDRKGAGRGRPAPGYRRRWARRLLRRHALRGSCGICRCDLTRRRDRSRHRRAGWDDTGRGDIGFSRHTRGGEGRPCRIQYIRLSIDLDTDASPEQRATLIRLTERYCVVYQTLRTPPAITVSFGIVPPTGDPGMEGVALRHHDRPYRTSPIREQKVFLDRPYYSWTTLLAPPDSFDR